MTDAGVVHEDIDPSVPVDHAGNGAFPRPWIGHIQLLDMHPISLLARQHVVERDTSRMVATIVCPARANATAEASPKPELQPVNARGVQERQPVGHRFLVRLPSRSPSAMRAGERLCRGLRIRHDIVRVEVLAEVGVRDELGVAGRKIGAGRIHPQPVLPGAELDLCDSLPA